MNWYDKLNAYFPVEEMKSKRHMQLLLEEKADVYHKDEGPEHVMMYAEFEQFTFVDYVWVSTKSRGQGIGQKLITKLKNKNKPILLEVEPVDESDPDTLKRLNFYKREGFEHAQAIEYNRKSLATNEENKLEILYWSEKTRREQEIYENMKQMYSDIHTYKDDELYGKSYQDVDDVLFFHKNKEMNDMLAKV